MAAPPTPFEDAQNCFVRYTNPQGTVLVAIVRDGTLQTQAVEYSDGTTQVTAGIDLATLNNAISDAIFAQTTFGGVNITNGNFDPSTNGWDQPKPALFVKDDDGTVWTKTGPLETDWTKLAFAA